jgi:hypothetical protein
MYHIGPEVMITSIRNMGVEVAHKQFFSCHCKQASDSMEPPFVVNRYPETKMALRMFLVIVSDRGEGSTDFFFLLNALIFACKFLHSYMIAGVLLWLLPNV